MLDEMREQDDPPEADPPPVLESAPRIEKEYKVAWPVKLNLGEGFGGLITADPPPDSWIQKGDTLRSIESGAKNGRNCPPYLYVFVTSRNIGPIEERKMNTWNLDVLMYAVKGVCLGCPSTEIHRTSGMIRMCRRCYDALKDWTGQRHLCSDDTATPMRHADKKKQILAEFQGARCLQCLGTRAAALGWDPKNPMVRKLLRIHAHPSPDNPI
ncbi:unnamed protein product, partial [Mesorhabditis spiculigera]